MTQQNTLVKFGGQPCVIMDPAKYPQARGKANGYCCPLGKSPGIGYVLMLRSAWDKIERRRNSPQTLEVLAGERITLPAMYIISAVKISGGRPNDPDSVYMVKFTDKRWIAAKLSDVTAQINVPCPAPPDDGTDASVYYADSLDSGSPFTWSRAVEGLWGAMPILGAFPGLPNAPDGLPENYQFLGVNAWDALHVLLDKLQCAVAYDPVANTFEIVQLGTTQSGLADALAGITRGYVDDAEPFDTAVADAPYTIRVYFSRIDLHYGSQKETTRASGTWATGPVTYVDTPTGITGAASGTILQLWDDLPAVAAFDGSLANSAAVNARAAERVARWKADREVSTPRLRTVYQGIVSGFRPGSQLKYVWWRNLGDGWLTEIGRHNGMMNLVDDAEGMRCDAAAENLAPPDLGRRTFPNFPQYLQLVTINGESGGDPDGTEVSPAADGLFDASVTRLNPDGATDTSGCFSASESCWVLVVNRETGSASASPTLKKGDRYLARLCGSKSARPVYMVQKGEESTSTDTTQWVVVEESVGIDDGTPVGETDLCLWQGKKVQAEADAETFCNGEDRFTKSDDVWIVVMDLLNGSGTPGARLYKGDRFLGKLVGTYTIDDDTRPLYAVRKGTQADIVKVVGSDPGDAAGHVATPTSAGLWDGIVQYPAIGTTTFQSADPYIDGPPCWILAPDISTGSVDPGAKLKKNDRHPAIYLGSIDTGGDDGFRPLYAIRKGSDGRHPVNFYNPGIITETVGLGTNEFRNGNAGTIAWYDSVGDLEAAGIENLSGAFAAFGDPAFRVLKAGLWRLDWHWGLRPVIPGYALPTITTTVASSHTHDVEALNQVPGVQALGEVSYGTAGGGWTVVDRAAIITFMTYNTPDGGDQLFMGAASALMVLAEGDEFRFRCYKNPAAGSSGAILNSDYGGVILEWVGPIPDA